MIKELSNATKLKEFILAKPRWRPDKIPIIVDKNEYIEPKHFRLQVTGVWVEETYQSNLKWMTSEEKCIASNKSKEMSITFDKTT